MTMLRKPAGRLGEVSRCEVSPCGCGGGGVVQNDLKNAGLLQPFVALGNSGTLPD